MAFSEELEVGVPATASAGEICDPREGGVQSAATEQLDSGTPRDDISHVETLRRVGRELTQQLETPHLLERLCQLTVEALQCDSSTTYVLRLEENAYVPVANHGGTQEQWETLRHLHIPRGVTEYVTRLEREDVFQLDLTQLLDSHPINRVPRQYGISRVLLMALRRGRELIGFHAACYLGRVEPFAAWQERLGEAMSHLATLALEVARLRDESALDQRVRSVFVGTLSHELRTPLQAIQGYHDLLLEGEYGPLTEEQAHILRRAYTSSQSLLDMMNEALDLSGWETRRIPLHVREVRLPELLDEVAVETDTLARKPGLRVSWYAAADLAAARTDPVKLKIVLKNLVGNAIKFSRQGNVTVEAGPVGGGVEFCVTDTGSGISSEMRRAIFEPFWQGGNTAAEPNAGAGLGLYIVRRLVDRLGGTVQVNSKVGQGSCFRVWIPQDVQEDGSPVSRVGS